MGEVQKRTSLVAIAIAISVAAGGCNQRETFLGRDAVTTAPTSVVPASPDDLARIAFFPPGNRGGTTGRGTVYLDTPARDGGLAVALTSSDPAIVTVTPQVFIPGGAMSADFSFTTRAVTRDVNVPITAASGERTLTDYVSVWTSTTSFLAYTADLGFANGPSVQRISSDAGGRFTAGCDRTNSRTLFGNASPTLGSGITVQFAAPPGQPTIPGVYDNTTNGATSGNFLSVSSVVACQGVGRVELHEVSLTANGLATALWFSFEQRCLNKPGMVRGTYRVVAAGVAAPASQCVR